MDYAAHYLTYDRFLHLTKWVIIHFAILVVGLYLCIIAGQTTFGLILIALALVVLGFGISRMPKVKRDIEDAMAGRPEAPRGAI